MIRFKVKLVSKQMLPFFLLFLCEANGNGRDLLHNEKNVDEELCGTFLSCNECLENGCSIDYYTLKCRGRCSIRPFHRCFDEANYPNMSISTICQLSETQKTDKQICDTQTDCTTCTETVMSDGITTCQWDVDYCTCEFDPAFPFLNFVTTCSIFETPALGSEIVDDENDGDNRDDDSIGYYGDDGDGGGNIDDRFDSLDEADKEIRCPSFSGTILLTDFGSDYDDCLECVAHGCSWFMSKDGEVECNGKSCNDDNNDDDYGKCYSKEKFPNASSPRICSEFRKDNCLAKANPTLPPTDVPTIDTTASPQDGYCFSGENLVEVMDDRGMVKMKSLKIGDSVRIQGGGFSKIYSFGHYDKHLLSEYIQIYVKGKNDSPLELSHKHMVFVTPKENDYATTTIIESIPAERVKVGDKLVTKSGTFVEVSEIKKGVQRRGAYAPFTYAGNLVVNDIVASNYVSMIPDDNLPFGVTMQWLAHMFTIPHRMICSIYFELCKNETYSTNGLSYWVYGPYHAIQWFYSTK